MPSSAISGVGVQFQRENDGSSGQYTAWAEVNSIEGPDPTRETIDVTSLDSTGGYREFIASFRDSGEVRLEMNFTRTTYEAAKTDFDSDDSVNYRISIPDADTTKIEFAAFITGHPLSITPDDKITVSVTLKITGEVTVTS